MNKYKKDGACMYIFKNAFLSIIRCKSRNIIIGIIAMAITVATCVALTINASGKTLINNYEAGNDLEVSFTQDMSAIRKQATDSSSTSSSDTTNKFEALTVKEIKNYGDSNLLSDYYYYVEAMVDSSQIKAVSNDTSSTSTNTDSSANTGSGDSNANASSHRPSFSQNGERFNMGSLRLTGYSNPAYIEDFTNGVKSVTKGTMFNSSETGAVCAVSSDLADANNLSVGNTITVYSPSNENVTYKLKIVAIFKDTTDTTTNSFAQMDMMNPRNQIYAPAAYVNSINEATNAAISAKQSTNTKSDGMGATIGRMMNGVSAKFFLKDKSNLDAFEKEVRKKGLSDFYKVTTNAEETSNSLTAIRNVSNFSLTFLILVLCIGGLVLAFVNMLNIRERKYEIGVLRAIGMSKKKVATQLISEIFMVTLASLIIGTGIGMVLAQPVATQMLKSEVASETSQLSSQTANFGANAQAGNFTRANMGGGFMQRGLTSGKIDYVSQLDVTTGLATLGEMLGLAILLTIITGAVSVLMIVKYEPMKILRDRN